jgi:CheY-like chemotaxis protein
VQKATSQGERSHRKLCVLVVDDDSLVLSGTAAMIEDLGHHTLEAGSGQQALACLTRDDKIDLVITDQVMPEMTGTELAAEIGRKWPHIPVILATGYAELSSDAGLHLLKLNKPFSQDMLSWAIVECTKESRPAPTVVAFRQRAPT